MINKILTTISEQDLQLLIDNEVSEGTTIEYKKELNLKTDGDKKEFLFDVSSFLNSSGGDLLIGIECHSKTRLPIALSGIENGILDKLKLQVENILTTGIDPPYPRAQLATVPLKANRSVLLIRIPKSWNGPHMVIFQNSNKFYSRNSAGKARMDVSELRAKFVEANSSVTKIQLFQVERVSRIYANETISPMPEGAKVILHAVPVASIGGTVKISTEDFASDKVRGLLKPISCTSWSNRFNLEGYASFDRNLAYAQLFRSGIIESVDSQLLTPYLERTIPSKLLENELILTLGQHLKILKHLQIDSPIAIFVTLTGVRGYTFTASNYAMAKAFGNLIAQSSDVLNLANNIIESCEVTPLDALKPILNSLWNAFDYEQSENF